MQPFWNRFVLILLVIIFAGVASAAPVAVGVFNAANWMPAGLPGHGIAQGSMFVITGTDMGSAVLFFPGTLPLSTELQGTSISVTVAGVTKNAFMVYTWTNQLAAVMPSDMPTGEGTFTITYNGETSAPFPILVVANAFGIFTRNQGGSGPAIVQNWYSPVDVRLNSLLESATGNQYMILWGSGLGGIVGDDSATPPIGNLDVTVRVLVGGREAVVQYSGRSAEFPGIDQIQFLVPPGATGCYVPLVVIVNGVVSNFGTIAVNPNGGICSDEVTFQAADLARAAQGQDVRLGGIALLSVNLSAPGLDESAHILLAAAEFGSLTPLSMLQSYGPMGFTNSLPPTALGSCNGIYGFGDGLEFDDPTPVATLDSGDGVSLNGPAPLGMMQFMRDGSTYLIESDDPDSQLVSGPYTIDNGAGGPDVGAFEADLRLDDTQFTWTNRDDIESVARGQDLRITWAGGNDSNEIVMILGHSNRTDLGVQGAYLCLERVSEGGIVIPSWMVSSLPVSSPWNGDGDATSGLIVGRLSRMDQNRFGASGIDAGFLFYLLADYRVVPYQ